MKILLSVIAIIPACYLVFFYALLPLKRKKAVALTPKLISLISISFCLLISLNLQTYLTVILITTILLIVAVVNFMNVLFTINTSKERIVQAINRVSLGMNLKCESLNDQIYISELDLKIKILRFGLMNILKFHSSSKSAKLKLFQSVTKKFITA